MFFILKGVYLREWGLILIPKNSPNLVGYEGRIPKMQPWCMADLQSREVTASSHLKIDAWKTIISFWDLPAFWQVRTVSFRECSSYTIYAWLALRYFFLMVNCMATHFTNMWGAANSISINFPNENGFRLLVTREVSSVENPGWLFDIGDYTTQLYGDYNKPL